MTFGLFMCYDSEIALWSRVPVISQKVFLLMSSENPHCSLSCCASNIFLDVSMLGIFPDLGERPPRMANIFKVN